jgi:hypothetical protein
MAGYYGLRITGASANGILVRSGGNTAAIDILGSGSGAGVYVQGGATGHAIGLVAGATSGRGVNINTTDGHGIYVSATGAGKAAAWFTAANGDGISAHAVPGGYGILAEGFYGFGASGQGGEGIWVRTSSGNVAAIKATGSGSGAGMYLKGGATGRGLDLEAGASNGEGLRIKSFGASGMLVDSASVGIDIGASSGSAIRATSAGGNGSGLEVTGNGTGSGIKATKGGGAAWDYDGEIESAGGVSGNVAGSVGSIVDPSSIFAVTIDGVAFSTIQELVMAMVDGKYAIGVPAPGQVTFYKRDSATPLFVMSVAANNRLRLAGP